MNETIVKAQTIALDATESALDKTSGTIQCAACRNLIDLHHTSHISLHSGAHVDRFCSWDCFYAKKATR